MKDFKAGDLIEFRRGSVGVRLGSLGLVVEVEKQERVESRIHGLPKHYFIYHIQTLDGKIRRFADSYLRKIK
jgi:hypothetical protein